MGVRCWILDNGTDAKEIKNPSAEQAGFDFFNPSHFFSYTVLNIAKIRKDIIDVPRNHRESAKRIINLFMQASEDIFLNNEKNIQIPNNKKIKLINQHTIAALRKVAMTSLWSPELILLEFSLDII